MIIFSCLVHKGYLGNTIAEQKQLVERLGFVPKTRLVWERPTEDGDIKRIEQAIQGRVPYTKSEG
jgi:N6-adenosine-specific RNA methylase IME4